MLPPTDITKRVHYLEDKYATPESSSVDNVPDKELQKFAHYAERYLKRAERANKHHWNVYSHSPEYRTAIDRLLKRLDTRNMTLEEIIDQFDEDPILSEHGRHPHDRANVTALLAKHELKWKRKPNHRPRHKREKECEV
ncbi:MAG TPA: hypothetical protein DDW71_00590 [Lactobacillus sp.]|nr:hypothetical protein [Lactobacillus sp.]